MQFIRSLARLALPLWALALAAPFGTAQCTSVYTSTCVCTGVESAKTWTCTNTCTTTCTSSAIATKFKTAVQFIPGGVGDPSVKITDGNGQPIMIGPVVLTLVPSQVSEAEAKTRYGTISSAHVWRGFTSNVDMPASSATSAVFIVTYAWPATVADQGAVWFSDDRDDRVPGNVVVDAFNLLGFSTIISPITAATVEGNGSNNFPWVSNVVRRYQQGHADITGSAKAIRQLAFRVNAPTANTTYTGTATVDMALLMSDTRPVDQMSFTLSANYLNAPTTVIARKVINMGPQGLATTPGPNPFGTANMALLLDSPYPYSGVNPLLWEAVIYSNTITVTPAVFAAPDVDSTNFTTGVSTITGPGCIATGRTVAMTHAASFTDAQGTLLINFSVANGPSSAAALLAVGLTSPNLPIPGLCSNLQTDLVLLIPIGATDATGAITTSTPIGRTFVFTPNTLAGAVITTQIHCVDPGRLDPIPVSNSDGRSVVVPASNRTKRVDAFRLFNNLGGTTATDGVFFGTSTLGYALVTEFTY